ncbi:MAG: homoserine O-acetyltransferase, partial [Thermoleophilia bacterium]|nr:homoserine O-acetyltransferase [Thermoleophilia bacterium]
MDYFDLFADAELVRSQLAKVKTKFLVLSFDTDWRFDTSHSRGIVRTLTAHRVPVTFREISSPHGHDSFLLDVPEYHKTVSAYLDHALAETV